MNTGPSAVLRTALTPRSSLESMPPTTVKAAVAIWDPYFYAQRAKNWMTAEGTDAGIATTADFNDWALYQGVEAYQTTEDAEGNPTTTRLEYQVVRNYQWANNYVANLNKPFTDLATAIDNAKATRNRGMNYLCDRATYKTAIEAALATLKQVRDNTSDATIEKDTQTLTAALEALNAATEAFLNSAEIPPVVDIDFSNPFEYVEGKDIAGFDISMGEYIAAKAGVKLDIVDMAFDSLIPALQAGSIDFIAAGMSITEERKKNVDFSVPYYASEQVIIIRK